jgi:hypothetical protein
MEQDQQLSETRRKEIFLALVEAQDRELTVADSRKHVAKQFNISERQVRQIEHEGIDNEWPPLT